MNRNDKLPAEFGPRPQGHGVTDEQWKTWEKTYDDLPALRLPAPFQVEVPKTAVTKEIYLAGQWVTFQLTRQGAKPREIQQACSDVGTSAFMVMQQGGVTSFIPQPLWKEAMRLARVKGAR